MALVFVQFRCTPGKTYDVANEIWAREVVSERRSRDKNQLAEVQTGLDSWRDEQRERLVNENRRVAHRCRGHQAEGHRTGRAGRPGVRQAHRSKAPAP